MQTRLLNESEIQYAKDLWDYCFEKSDDPFFQWYFASYVKPQYVLGSFIDQDFAGMIHLNPYQLCLHGQQLDTTYFVGVATAPVHRRKGVMQAMLKKAFALLRERGQSLVLLMPVMAGIYLPYGFAYCYHKLKYQMSLVELARILPKVSGYEIAFANEKNLDILSELYKKYTKGLNGFLLRGTKEWDSILDELLKTQRAGYAVVVKNQTGYCGYMLYFIKDDLFRIVELVALNDQAKTALLSYVAQHASQCSEFFWQAPQDDLTYLRLQLNKDYPTVQPFMMGRILDPVQAVADLQLAAPQGTKLALKLEDSVIETNNGVFVLEEAQGKAQLAVGQDEQAQVQMSIGTFAQLCFGAYTARDLHKAGAIKTDNLEALATLAQVFGKQVNYINEYF